MNIWARWLADLPASLQRLIARTHRVSLPRGATADVRVARLRAALCPAASVRAVYFALPTECREALQLLRTTPRGVNADALSAQLGPLRPLAELRADPRPRSIAERLVLAGWLLPRPATAHHPARFLLPPELRRRLPALLSPPAEREPTALDATITPPAATAAAVIVLAAAEIPLALRSDRTPRAETLRRLASRLAPLPPDQAHELVRWLVPLLVDLHLLVAMPGGYGAAPDCHRFLQHAPAERVRRITAAWLAASPGEPWLPLPSRARAAVAWPALRRRLLAWAASVPAGRTLPLDGGYPELAAAFGPLASGAGHLFHQRRRAPWSAPRSARAWSRALAGPLRWLGVVSLECAAQGEGWVTSHARPELLADEQDHRPADVLRLPCRWIYGSPGELLIATDGLDADLLQLLPFARWERACGAQSVYRVDRRSLARATSQGHARSALRALLEQRAGPLPAAWLPLLDEAAPAVQIVHAAVAIAADAELLGRAARRRSVRRYMAAQLAPGIALVEPTAVAGLERTLGREGVAVSVTGGAQVAPPAALSPGECELLLAACAFYREHGPGAGQSLELLSERLRAQLPPSRAAQLAPQRALADEPPVPECPGTAPVSPPQNAVAELRRAIDRRRAVTITYQAADAPAPTHRTVRPLRLYLAGDCWYLEAFCLRRQAERTFRVDRILNLTPHDGRPPERPERRRRRPEDRAQVRHRSFAGRRPGHEGGAWLEED